MKYDKIILRVLNEAGDDGLSVRKISKHVYNACNSLFETVSYEDVHQYVLSYLKRNSKKSDSMIERSGIRGVYHLNYNSNETRQLMLEFQEEMAKDEDEDEDEDKQTQQSDQSLSLF